VSMVDGLALVTSQTAIPEPAVRATSAPAAVVTPQRRVTSCATGMNAPLEVPPPPPPPLMSAVTSCAEALTRVTFAAGDRDAVSANKEPRAIRNVGEPSDNARCSVSDTHSRSAGCVEQGLTDEAAFRVVHHTRQALGLTRFDQGLERGLESFTESQAELSIIGTVSIRSIEQAIVTTRLRSALYEVTRNWARSRWCRCRCNYARRTASQAARRQRPVAGCSKPETGWPRWKGTR